MHSPPQSKSVAALIVTLAAERVEDVDPKFILMKLEDERIREDWQLEFLDAHQWQMLGVPMGLVAAIRRCLVERKETQQKPTQECPISSKASSPLYSTPKSSVIPPEEPEAGEETSTSPRAEPVRHIRLTKSAVPPMMPRRRQSDSLEWDQCPEQQELFYQWLSASSAPPSKPMRMSSVSLSTSSMMGDDEYVIHEEGDEHP